MTVQGFRAWIDYMSIPVPRHLRQMGCVRELGPFARGATAAKAPGIPTWSTPARRSWMRRRGASSVAARSSSARGCRSTFDIPLEALSRQFEIVVLVDIVHAWSVHRQAARLSNVRLLPLDVTGEPPSMDRTRNRDA